jgi:dinuclear metal center YbgI/SA1388 family protein
MKLQEIITVLEQIAPPTLQESYDNSGLLTGNGHFEVKGVLLCLDMTEEVIDEAIALGYNVIIGHHPIIFSGLKRINGSNYVERAIIKAIKADIALYAIHTNLDNVLSGGVNERIAQHLGLSNVQVLSNKWHDVASYSGPVGGGAIGYLPEPLSLDLFLSMVANRMQTSCIRYAGILDRMITKVAVCGGAGSFLLKEAVKQGADVFITADFKYHEFFDAEDKILIADIGHYESEQYTIDLLFDIMQNNFPNFAVRKTGVNTNPIKYHI